MKSFLLIFLILTVFPSFGIAGTHSALEGHLQDEFISLDSVGSLLFLGGTDQCDEVIDVLVVGDMGAGKTAYSCAICLQNDSGLAQVNSQESSCMREE